MRVERKSTINYVYQLLMRSLRVIWTQHAIK